MITTNPATVGTRIRARLWRRILIGLSAAVLYTGVAMVLAFALPDSAWPAIGGDGYAPGQATIVPALNLFAVGVLVIAVFALVVPVALRIAASIALGIAAAVAGPLLAAVEGTAADLFAPGVIASAAVGIALAAACAAFTSWASHKPAES